MSGTVVSTWTIYDHPSDFTEGFIARRYTELGATDEVIVATDINDLRVHFSHLGLVPITRDPSDDATIVETWI